MDIAEAFSIGAGDAASEPADTSRFECSTERLFEHSLDSPAPALRAESAVCHEPAAVYTMLNEETAEDLTSRLRM